MRRGGAFALLICVAVDPIATFAYDLRDLEFECPCSAIWIEDAEDPAGERGKLTLTFGVRSHRGRDSSELRLTRIEPRDGVSSRMRLREEGHAPIGTIRAGAILAEQQRTMAFDRPESGSPIGVALLERIGDGLADWDRDFVLHESLVLWPAPGEGNAEPLEYVDILTDRDGDGIGDVNEGIAGTAPEDPASRPGLSTIDVLAYYNEGFAERFGGYPHARIHHVMVLTNAMYADSGAQLRLRTVGMSEVELEEYGRPRAEEYEELLERHGADVALQFHHGPNWTCGVHRGCSSLGNTILKRGYWRDNRSPAAVLANAGALVATHELGHYFGLAHSARQGEAHGAFRWSRGHYVDSLHGTIMSYGFTELASRFSNPDANCVLGPCGVPVEKADGAHAVASLDLLRFQIANRRESRADSDGCL